MKSSKLSRSWRKSVTRHDRELILARCLDCCEICGFHAGPVIELHHVIPVASGGDNYPDNVMALCPNCHRAVTVCAHTPETGGAYPWPQVEWLFDRSGYPREQAALIMDAAQRNVELLDNKHWRAKGSP